MAATLAAPTGWRLGAGATTPSPEANPIYFGNLPYHVNQAIWTAPMTNKLLLEAGFTRFMFRGGTTGRPAPDGIMNLIPVTEQSTATNPLNNDLPFAPRANFAYRGVATANPNYANPNSWRASASYVTGSHEMKVGYQGAYIRVNNWFLVNEQQLAYRFNLGVPNQFTFRLPEWHQSDRTGTAALYIQDKWTRGRLTPQGALRYDRAWSFTPAEYNGTELTSPFNTAPISFPETPGVDSFNDITPRFGAAYDVFGNGKTALKFNIGHYLDAATNDSEYTSNSPAARIVRTGTRNWDDRFFPVGDPRRDNKVIDCDIMNFAANGECPAVTGDTLNFGQASGNITQVNQETLRRLGRASERLAVGTHRAAQVIPRMSVEVVIQPPVVPGRKGDRQYPSRSRRTTSSSRSPRHRIRGCRAAAATRSPSVGDAGGLRSRREELRHVRHRLRPGAQTNTGTASISR